MSDKSTQPRLDATKVSPDLYKAMLGLEEYVEGSGLEQKLLDLVKIRACFTPRSIRPEYTPACR